MKAILVLFAVCCVVGFVAWTIIALLVALFRYIIYHTFLIRFKSLVSLIDFFTFVFCFPFFSQPSNKQVT